MGGSEAGRGQGGAAEGSGCTGALPEGYGFGKNLGAECHAGEDPNLPQDATEVPEDRSWIMERGVDQLVQDERKVIWESAATQYQPMQDLLVRKSIELQDAPQNAGGIQYAELQF